MEPEIEETTILTTQAQAIMLYKDLSRYVKFSSAFARDVFTAGYRKSYELSAAAFGQNSHANNYAALENAALCLQHVTKIMRVVGEEE